MPVLPPVMERVFEPMLKLLKPAELTPVMSIVEFEVTDSDVAEHRACAVADDFEGRDARCDCDWNRTRARSGSTVNVLLALGCRRPGTGIST